MNRPRENLNSKLSPKRDTRDQFGKDLIKTTDHKLIGRHGCGTLKTLKNLLKKDHNRVLSKCKLMKTLHGIGFKYIKKMIIIQKVLWKEKTS